MDSIDNFWAWITSHQDQVVSTALSVFFAVAIFFIGKWFAGFVSRWVKELLLKKNGDPTLSSFLMSIVYYTLLALTFIAAISELGVATASFVAILGAAGLAIGLSLSGLLQHFAAGVMIISFRPFRIGDFIEAGGTSGVVKEIGIFNTTLATADNRKVIAPNNILLSGVMVNWSDISERRVDLVFGISYENDMAKAKSVLLDLVSKDERVLKDPAPLIAVNELADSSVNIVCRPWVRPQDYWSVYFDFTERGRNALEAAGMSIPFPQTDVHLNQKIS